MARKNRNQPQPASKPAEAQLQAGTDQQVVAAAASDGAANADQTVAGEQAQADVSADIAATGAEEPNSSAHDGQASADPAGGSEQLPPAGEAPEGGWCYEVIEPFRMGRAIVKPGVWIQLTDEQAEIYSNAGVIGPDQAWPPQEG